MTNYTRSLRLSDLNGATLAEILMPDDFDDGPLILMPSMGMYFEAQQDHSRPHVRTGPYRMHEQSFLSYLAAIAAAEPDASRALVLTGESRARMYCEVRLSRHIQADELAEITGIPLDKVRHYLACHLTFPEVTL